MEPEHKFPSAHKPVMLTPTSLVNAINKLLASCTPVKEYINVTHFTGTGKQVDQLPQVNISHVIPAKGFIAVVILWCISIF